MSEGADPLTELRDMRQKLHAFWNKVGGSFANGLQELDKQVAEMQPGGGTHREQTTFPRLLPQFIKQAGGPKEWAAKCAEYLLGGTV